jgi:hypothetical protein
MLETISAGSPDGRINAASMPDIQASLRAGGPVAAQSPAEKLVTETYVEHANRTLGPFQLANAGSTLPGCR